jgi:hypothetical protein
MVNWWLLKKGFIHDIAIPAALPESMGLDYKLMVSGRLIIYMEKSRGLSTKPAAHVSMHFILCVLLILFLLVASRCDGMI